MLGWDCTRKLININNNEKWPLIWAIKHGVYFVCLNLFGKHSQTMEFATVAKFQSNKAESKHVICILIWMKPLFTDLIAISNSFRKSNGQASQQIWKYGRSRWFLPQETYWIFEWLYLVLLVVFRVAVCFSTHKNCEVFVWSVLAETHLGVTNKLRPWLL